MCVTLFFTSSFPIFVALSEFSIESCLINQKHVKPHAGYGDARSRPSRLVPPGGSRLKVPGSLYDSFTERLHHLDDFAAHLPPCSIDAADIGF